MFKVNCFNEVILIFFNLMKSINFYNFNFVVLPNFEYKQNKEL